jgi:hypothetical protein
MIVNAEALANKWAEGWSGSSPEPWLAMYSARARYIDHAFQIVRIGNKTTLASHWHIWRKAHPDFKLTVTTVYPPLVVGNGKVKVIFRTDNKGTFQEDLPSKKATGNAFLFKGVVEFVVDEKTGLIEELDEWYSHFFERSMSPEDYNRKEDSLSAL